MGEGVASVDEATVEGEGKDEDNEEAGGDVIGRDAGMIFVAAARKEVIDARSQLKNQIRFTDDLLCQPDICAMVDGMNLLVQPPKASFESEVTKFKTAVGTQ